MKHIPGHSTLIHYVISGTVVLLLLLVYVILPATGLLARPDTARTVLEQQGYTSIETNGYAWFRCGHDDVFATRFSADTPSGARVDGAVCSGLLKGSTVRITNSE